MSSPSRWPSEDVSPAPLGEPIHFEFSGRTAPNRFMKAAMTERLSSWDAKTLENRGIPSKELVNLYKRWGEGEYGVILTGNVMVDYHQLEAAGNPIIPRDAPHSGPRFDGFRDLATAAKAHGSLVVAQVSHPGRQVPSLINPSPISASDVQLQGEVMGMTFGKPRAATEADISDLVERFAQAAVFLEKAGYDGMQLHGAHGYLLAQFLSPTTNRRTDAYGGSVENRARIVVEIGREVRRRTGKDFVLGIKMNSVEFQDKGLTSEEAGQIAAILERETFDFVELSGGTYEKMRFAHERDSTRKREAFFLEFAELVAPHLKRTRAYVTGGFKTVGAMVGVLHSVDGVGLGRPTCSEPLLAKLFVEDRIRGVVVSRLPEQDWGTAVRLAGTQIKQLGFDQQPLDPSSQESIDSYLRYMAASDEEAAKNGPDLSRYGHLDSGLPPIPYAPATLAQG